MEFLNKKIGKLYIFEKCGEKSTGKNRSLKIYKCRCECGNETMQSREQLTRNQTPACEKCARKVRFLDLTNQNFGKLTVVDIYEKGDYKLTKWNCLCQCGNTKQVLTTQLKNGNITDCGCVYKNKDKTRTNLIGEQFGKLKVIAKAVEQSMWVCKCECGNETTCRSTSLKHGLTKSCGCFRIDKMTGENNKLWKGGINKDRENRIRQNGKFQSWSLKVRERDINCQKCGSNDNLNAHHIFNYNSYPEKAFDLDNGIALCNECHKKFHRVFGKIKNNDSQLNEFLKE